eukprot:3047727-Amphidinium_carterae.1
MGTGNVGNALRLTDHCLENHALSAPSPPFHQVNLDHDTASFISCQVLCALQAIPRVRVLSDAVSGYE